MILKVLPRTCCNNQRGGDKNFSSDLFMTRSNLGDYLTYSDGWLYGAAMSMFQSAGCFLSNYLV
jgi:hypothetical protein